MATAKGKIKFVDVLAATGGGFASAVVMNQLDKKVPLFASNKNLSPLVNGAMALGVLYFGGSQMEATAFGMLGSSGADFGDAMQGLSRLDAASMDGDIEDLEEALDTAEENLAEMGVEVEDEDTDDDGA